jgi:hypothetical protein
MFSNGVSHRERTAGEADGCVCRDTGPLELVCIGHDDDLAVVLRNTFEKRGAVTLAFFITTRAQ